MADAPKTSSGTAKPFGDADRRVQELTAENARLRARNAALQVEQKALTQRLLELESYNQLLQNLFVTTYRLHSTLERAEVLATLHEILTNLVGVEEYGLWAVDADGALGKLLLQSDDGEVQTLSPAEAELVRSTSTHDAWFRENVLVPPAGVDALAIVPFKAGSDASGALVIRKLLDHKRGLGKLDRQLLGVLAEQAGIALLSSQLHSGRHHPV